MYENLYSLREKPFALTPDPAYLYLAKRHRHALTMLEYALAQATGFALITGEVGCGKTTVVRHFLERTDGPLNVGFSRTLIQALAPCCPGHGIAGSRARARLRRSSCIGALPAM